MLAQGRPLPGAGDAQRVAAGRETDTGETDTGVDGEGSKATRAMSAELEHRLPHHPALDGLRGLAVLAVLFFHADFVWARGGYLGVSTFFTLSGFLITGLLLHEHARQGRIDLARFWVRRVRRLLPALLAALLGVVIFAALVSDVDQLSSIRRDALATLFSIANWRFIHSRQAYVDLFGAPSPLLHAWSLGIEDQFYFAFPLILSALLRWGDRRALLGGVTALAALSVGASLLLHGDQTRVYFGTDTRIVEILTGALLAAWAARPDVALSVQRRPLLALLGIAAAALTVCAWYAVEQTAQWLYLGGFAGYGLVSAALVAAAVAPGPVRSALSWPALRHLGLISYGVYLYHWPIFLWLSPDRTGLDPYPLFALRSAATLALAIPSYLLLEQPIRRGALRGWRAAALVPVSAIVVAGALFAATTAPERHGRLRAEERPSTPVGVDAVQAPRFGGLVRQASAGDPLRVLMVGDSLSWDAEPAVLAALSATGAARPLARNELGFGLTRGSNWRASWPTLMSEQRIELLVVFVGAWDELYIADAGIEAYERVVEELIGLTTAGESKVLLVGLPMVVLRGSGGAASPRKTRVVFQNAAARHASRVEFLDLDPYLSPRGRFTFYVDGPNGRERIRKLDGAHFCPAGSALIARAVLDAIGASWGLPAPDAAWRAGDWALDPRFHNPPGICPEY
jgi:peptidoglycan/LPS O-acetylase OafA/YrhL